MTHTHRIGRRCIVLGIVALAGCRGDEPIAPRAVETPLVVTARADGQSKPQASIRRVDLHLAASGSLQPGSPITVTVRAHANRDAKDASIELLLLDSDEPVTAQTVPTRAQSLAQDSSPLREGMERTSSTTVTFRNPGYYRVLARARSQAGSQPASHEVRGDTAVLGFSTEVLWLLVDDKGGRATRELDSELLRGRGIRPAFGAAGPFVAQSQAGEANGVLRTEGANFMTGHLQAYDYESAALVPVAGALVSLQCRIVDGDYQYETTTGPTAQSTAATDSSGYFSIETACPDSTWQFLSATFQLGTPEVSVWGPNRADATVSLYSPGDYGNLRVVNDVAVRVYNILRTRAPLAAPRFGRTIAQTLVYVSASDSTYGPYYCANAGPNCPTGKLIVFNYSRAWGADGYFSATHEYGHGYQWYGIEPWASYACTGGSHGWTETENNSCGFVEGFADFFAMWLAGDVIGQDPYGGDYGIEHNLDSYYWATNPPSGGDGVRVEAAVGAFFYDLVDNGSERDGPYNNADGDESFDNMSVPGSWIADIMAACRPGGTTTRLDGSDQLVYCLEKSPSAYTESRRWSTAWRSYGSIGFDRVLPSYDAASIRRLWKYNMYGVLE